MDSESAEISSQHSATDSDHEPPANVANVKPYFKATDVEPPAKAADTGPPVKVTDAKPPPKAATDISSAIATNLASPAKAIDIVPDMPAATHHDHSPSESTPSVISTSGLSSWARNLRFLQQDSQTGSAGMSKFARFTSGLGLHLPAKAPGTDENTDATSTTTQGGVLESFTKGLVDSSRTAVKAMQVKARHIVSQNKRRYQEGEFDLDMTYITENIIAMGFPAGDLSSGLFGFFEGFYRNHMEEVIKFFETHHKGKYKVYNLCSERLYDASRFEGKVASFPFDDHNCPPIQLIPSFCQSAYSWLKEDIQNVVVVHCKAGMARTGLMICSLLLFLKFFPTAEEVIHYYNQKRCVDGKALVLPSQIRYVKYFESVLTYFNGKSPPGRRCMLRGFRLHKCPYWVRPSITISNHSGVLFSTRKHPKTKDLMPEDFWIKAPKKGIIVFALPGEPGLTELAGDFKIHFHEGQGDFYCWLNTTMTENRKILNASDLDGFDKRKLPSPGFRVEIVMVDYNDTLPTRSKAASSSKGFEGGSGHVQSRVTNSHQDKASGNEDKDDVFSDSEGEESGASKVRQAQVASASGLGSAAPGHVSKASEQIGILTHGAENLSLGKEEPKPRHFSNKSVTDAIVNPSSGIEISHLDLGANDIKAIAADASVFSFGDEDDYESE